MRDYSGMAGAAKRYAGPTDIGRCRSRLADGAERVGFGATKSRAHGVSANDAIRVSNSLVVARSPVCSR